MNKKFSTLVAVLLAAGAWNTLDARVVKVTNPAIGGSYLIGTSVVTGDAANGTVNTILQVADGASPSASDDAIQTYGNEWTLVATESEVQGENWFYLKAGDKYLIASTTANTFGVDADGTHAVPFKINENGEFVVAKSVTNTSTTDADKVLKLTASSAATAVTAGSGNLEFGIYQADAEVTINTSSDATDQALVSSFNKDTYYFIGADKTHLLNFDDENAAKAGTATPVDGASLTDQEKIDASLWKVIETTINGVTTYSFENKLYPGKLAKVGQTSSFNVNAKYNKGVALYVGDKALTNAFAAAVDDKAIAFGFYEATQTPYTVAELKKELVDGFNLSIALKEGDKTAIKGTEAFTGKLVPVGPSFDPDNLGADDEDAYFKLMNGTKYVVLDTEDQWPNNIGDETKDRGAKFKLIDKKDLEVAKTKAANLRYLSDFVITHSAGKLNSDELIVSVKDYGRLFIAANEYLTTSNGKGDNETWAYASKGASNLVDVKALLGKFWNISFATPKADVTTPDEYKLNGVLAVSRNAANTANVADYVAASSVLLSSPETQWAVVSVSDAGFTLQNRETNVKVQDVKLRMTSTPNVYTVETVGGTEIAGNNIASDFIKLTEVKDITKYDGFMRTEPNTLRNQVFNIGQYHNETGNVTAYWAENHGNSHKLGVVTEGATDWKLYLDMKSGDLKNEVDTVLVITKLAALQADGTIKDEAAPDTLAVLPYLVQNNSNLEYVLYKGNKLNYYACDEHENVEASAQRFALKMKPNGTYNVVTIADQPGTYAKTTALGASKVFVANSEQWGSLDNLNTYSKDNNSLMVVEEIDKPEYRKVAKEWGDIVKIYREEYPTEVLFEKRDAKSVVDGETLSFLNVNNSVSGANPALFVDTAYVNRVDKDGIANTCYQYLLAVNVDKENSVYCPYNPEHNTDAWREEHGGPCADAKENAAAVKGRFLINLIDTANVYGATHLHNNPYVNGIEAGEKRAKLSFVDGIHTKDTLYITRKGGEVVPLAMNSPEFNVAKFAFRYVDNAAGSFKIQTRFKDYNPADLESVEENASNNGYLKWINGTVVVERDFINGETFNMEENYDGQAVANEDITTTTVKVTTAEGKVIIAGAQGKKVTISNVLGQTVANTVISSDNATISAPAGVVVVAVEGEAAVKAIVK